MCGLTEYRLSEPIICEDVVAHCSVIVTRDLVLASAPPNLCDRHPNEHEGREADYSESNDAVNRHNKNEYRITRFTADDGIIVLIIVATMANHKQTPESDSPHRH